MTKRTEEGEPWPEPTPSSDHTSRPHSMVAPKGTAERQPERRREITANGRPAPQFRPAHAVLPPAPGAHETTPREARAKAIRRDQGIPSASSYPQCALAISMLRALMASRGAPALFRGRLDEALMDRHVTYRATAFWQAKPTSDRMHAFLRCNYGELEVESQSGESFARSEPFVGLAWQKLDQAHGPIGMLCHADDVPNLQDLLEQEPDHDEARAVERWRMSWRDRGVPEAIASRLGTTTGYATRVRSVACIGVRSAYGDIVICVESVRKHGFVTQMLMPEAVQRARESRRAHHVPERRGPVDTFEDCCRSLLKAHVIGHVDFWTWFRRERATRASAWSAAASLLSLVTYPAKLLEDKLGALLRTTNPLHSLLAWPPKLMLIGGSIFALLLVGAFMLMPERNDVTRSAEPTIHDRLETFSSRLFAAYLLTVVFLALLLAHGILGDPPTTWSVLLEGIAIIVSVAASYYALAAYFSVARYARPPDKPVAVIEVPAYVKAAMVITALIATLCVMLPPSQTHPHAAVILGRCMVAGASGLSLCLLVSCLDSRLIGTPGWVVTLLYVDALAHTLCGLLFTVTAHAKPYDPRLQVPLALAYALRLPLDVLLFAVIVWAVRGRALERYLAFVANVAPTVPRTSWRNSEVYGKLGR